MFRGLDPVGSEDQAWVDGVDSNIVLHNLIGECFGKHHQRCLGDIINRLVPQRLNRADRRVVENHTASAFPHGWNQPACQTDRRHHMEIPVVLPLLVRSFHDRLATAGACIVNQDIGATEFAFRFGDYLLNRRRHRNIGRYSERSDAELFGDPRCLRFSPVALSATMTR